MTSDCAISIGSTHSVCQDYARAGKKKDNPFVLVADGCTSSADTDIGARLLTLSAELQLSILNDALQAEFFHKYALEYAAEIAFQMKLDETCLDATLMTISLDKQKWPIATIYGDGILVVGKKNGDLEVTDVSFTQNYPLYSSYQLNEVRMKQMPDENEIVVKRYVQHPDGKIDEAKDCWADAMEFGFFVDLIRPEETKFVVVMTDGAKSFLSPSNSETSKTFVNVALNDILRDLVGFKTFQPGFVQRRMQRLQKDFKSKGWQHHDDFSIGALSLE